MKKKKKKSILLSALNLHWSRTKLLAEGIGKVVGLIWMRLWILKTTMVFLCQRKMSMIFATKIITTEVKNMYKLNRQQSSLKLSACSVKIVRWLVNAKGNKQTNIHAKLTLIERRQFINVIQALSEITACQTVVPFLVVKWYIFSWGSFSVSDRLEKKQVS